MSGRLIAIEGPDGAGRTSHARTLCEYLDGRGMPCTFARLKGSTLMRAPLRELQRKADIGERALFLLYAADLADVLQHTVLPALAEGRLVVLDRYVLTPRARASLRGIDAGWAADVLSFAPPADLTAVLEADARLRLSRLLQKRRFLQPREAGTGSLHRKDLLDQALRYQRQLGRTFAEMAGAEGALEIDASRESQVVQDELRSAVLRLTVGRAPSRADGGIR